MIGIIDYGMGNLFSVSKALERIGVDYCIGDRPELLEGCDGYILPGVGAFPDAMKALDLHGFIPFIKAEVSRGVPLYGICLGMQLLFESSEEGGWTEGLGLFPGTITRFPGVDEEGKSYKVPHMGWNELDIHKPGEPLLANVKAEHVYFVHSYVARTEAREILYATSDYHVEVPAIIGKENLVASQFHPEKSGRAGMQLLENFCKVMCKQGVV
ncbi:imidazole glycerol phosphate synthase subunit HisH [Halobacillus sp. ACCC02827]|uniref:imidazole glycerol phosphate synthase subunit HisH n=1 Tax=Bacillaceae TaxID=186817 RepID=UPI0002A509E4|nr:MULTISPECIES: imidazole glycerol phosphate synthase subunit HisH [Bacillaceae]ELK47974.1 imidazole glycerol phosphate synthase subunit HisH [Halobacillus sp. BAB-2008]QHT47614.1 imidazole glycerol phosphate synthase subunit HisH [Bacillus sp. SB49]WJE14848.1 imidazole glycerol phosphate synthase subunit HisH [Halobacillus sp. ACCC02827]